MEEKKEPKKIKLSTVILIFIILMLIVVLIGVVSYYQNKTTNHQINSEENNTKVDGQLENGNNIQVNTTSKKEIRSLAINTEQVQSLYSKILKSNAIYGEDDWNESFYKDTKVTDKELSNREKNIAVLQAIKDNPTSSINTNSIDKSKIHYGYEGIESTAKVYSKQLLESTAKDLFGESNQTIQWETIDNNAGFIYDYINEQYYAYAYQGGGFGCPVRACTNLIKAEEDEENIYLYDEFIFVENTPESTTYYTSSNKTNIIDKINNYEELDARTVLSKYSEKAKQYKHVFKKNIDGSNYWLSTEPIA